MAINPLMLKALGKVAIGSATDEKTRRVILITCLVPFIIILLVFSSPFAIFFSKTGNGTDIDTLPISNTMDSLRERFFEKIRVEENDNTVDVINTIILGSEDNSIINNSKEVMMIFSIKYNVIDDGADQVAVLSKEQIEKLSNVFWDMNNITTNIEEIEEEISYTATNENGEKIIKTRTIIKKIKTIYIEFSSAEIIARKYEFNKLQLEVLEEMKKIENILFNEVG